MKSLEIDYKELNINSSESDILSSFNVKKNNIDVVNWKDFKYKPDVTFQIIYSSYAVYIKYDVIEQSILGTKVKTNDPVYKDSCVEFFVSTGNGLYYNFEFNCIGTRYAGFGKDRGSGSTMDYKKVEKIRTFPTLGFNVIKELKRDTAWSLVVEIPFEIFSDKQIDKIKGSSMRANFYKCGDELSVPHFVTWNSINNETPDFHRPECFGVINFK